MNLSRLFPDAKSMRAGLVFAASPWFSAATAVAQMPSDSVSPGIPHLSDSLPELPPHLADGAIPGEVSGVPQPGFRPQFAMTPVYAHAPGHACLCGHRSLWQKIRRKKCQVHPDIPVTFVPNQFEEPPLGEKVYRIMDTQVRNHDATRQVLNHYDFADDSSDLNYAGKRKLMRMARGSQTNFAPIVVEATPRQPGLDVSRRSRLIQEIASLGLPIPPERVIVGQSYTPGVRGADAIILYQGTVSALSQSAQGGTSSFGANAMGGMNAAGMLPIGGGSSGSGSGGNTGGF